MLINLQVVTVFFLIMTRFVGLMITAPVFSRKELSLLPKVMFLFWTSGLFIFLVPVSQNVPDNALAFGFAFMSELLIGALIGFVTDLLVSGMEFAGSLMDTQAGLSVASLLDPSSGRSMSLLSLLLKWTATMMFLAIDGHHLVLSALMQSFNLLPVGQIPNFSAGMLYVARLGTYIFALAVQLSAPILLVVFMVDFGFGMLNKVAEQINVFQMGFQIKPIVSVLVFLAIAPGLVSQIYTIMEHISEHLLRLFFYLGAT